MLKEFDVYSVMALAFGVAAFLGALIFGAAKLLTKGVSVTHPPAETPEARGQGRIFGLRLHIRYTTPMVMSLLLITLALLIVPCSGWFAFKNDGEARLRWLTLMLTLSGSALFSVLYCAEKGDLSWEKS